MLINFVLISGKRLTLDCDPNDTIKDILQRIINSFQLQDYKTVKLIYKGKKLNENDEIKTLNYSPNQLVIVHAQDKKKKEETSSTQPNYATSESPTSTSPPTSPTLTTSSPPSTLNPPSISTSSSIPTQSLQTSALEPDRPPPADNIPQYTTSENSGPPILLPEPEKWASNLQSLVEMGFDEELSKQALIQAYNQPDRAVEILTNGSIDTSHDDDSATTSYETMYPSSSTQNTTESNDITPTHNSNTNIPISNQTQPYIFSYRNNDEDQDAQPTFNLPEPSPHPLPDANFPTAPAYYDTTNSSQDVPRVRNENVRQVLPDYPPSDPTIEPDEDFELIRQTIIRDPLIADYIYDILKRHFSSGDINDVDNPNNIFTRITSNQSIFYHLMGIPLAEPFPIPESFTNDDITSIYRLHHLGGFTWQQIIDAYEESQRSEELASAILLSLSVFN